MSNPLQFSLGFGGEHPEQRQTRGEPLRILYLADLGETCRSRTSSPIASRPIRRVDIDNFADLLDSEQPKLELSVGEVMFREIEDFHPDELCTKVEIFPNLDGLCRRLRVPSTFEAAAREVRSMLQTEDTTPHTEPKSDDEDDADTLSRLLGKPSSAAPSAPPQSAPPGLLDTLVQKAVQAHIIADADPRADQYVTAVEAAATAHLRNILHNPDFQAIEAAWKSLNLLVSNIETDGDLSLEVWNVGKVELIEAMGPTDTPPEHSILHQRLIEQRHDAPFTLIVSDFNFGVDGNDLRLLATLGATAGRSGAVVVTGVAPDMIGAETWSAIAAAPRMPLQPGPGWAALCASAIGQHIVAVGPRFILRTPYGKRLDPTDTFFAFEELEQPGDPNAPILWGTSSVIAAILFAQSYAQDGWDARLSTNRTYVGLPFVPFDENGEKQMRPCTETLLSDSAAEMIVSAGVSPVSAARNQDNVFFPRFQSIGTDTDDTQLGPFKN